MTENAEETAISIEEYSKLTDTTKPILECNLTKPILECNLIDTFRHMTWRKLSRLRNGHTKKRSTGQILWVVLVVLLFFAMAGVLATRKIENVAIQILIFLFVIFMSYLIVKVSLKLRWFLYWLVGAVIAMAFYVDLAKIPTESFPTQAIWVFIVFGTLEVMTLFGYLFSWYIHPIIVLSPLVDPVFWWSIKPGEGGHSRSPSTISDAPPIHLYTYCTFDRIWRISREFSYQGELHPETGKPHGFGRWTDNSVAGEYLVGYWDNGIPVGPFESNEYATGFTFSNTSVGFCIATADKWDECALIPRYPKDNKLSFGVAGVECSLAGKFFEDLPRANLVEISEDLDHLVDLMCMEVPNENQKVIPQVTIALEDGNLVVPGYTHGSQSLSQITLTARDGELIINELDGQHEQGHLEALIFVPGFNCPLYIALERVAQMLALISFPPHIKTFIYNWPAAQIMTYHMALKTATSERTVTDFGRFIKELHATGRFKTFHILGHSMGARLVLNASKAYSDLFCDLNSESADSNKPSLSTFTLINPEADLDAFTTEHYAHVADVCNIISLFVDESDGALNWAEIFSRQRMLGRYATRNLRKKYRKNGSKDFASSQHSPSDSESSSSIQAITNVNTPDEKGSRSPKLNPIDSPRLAAKKPRLRLGSLDMTYIGFDLDCLDMTQLDANVHALRHCYFNINRLVLDDLREIIVMKKRAKYRSNRLLRVDSNVFTFISAPSFLVNP